jgi:hypothetical protein
VLEDGGQRADEAERYVNLADPRPADRGANQIEQPQQRDGIGATDRIDVLGRRLEPDRSREARGHLVDGDRLQALHAAADDGRHRVAADHRRQHVHELIAAAVDDRGPEDRPGDRAGPDRLFRRPLGAVVARARVGPRAECAHVQVAADARRGGALQHVDGSLDVDALERGVGGAVLANDPDQVDDGVAAGDAALQRLAREHVTLDALDCLLAAQIPFGAATHQAAHAIALGAERVNHGPADETRGAGHEDPTRAYHRLLGYQSFAERRLAPAKIDRWFDRLCPAGSSRHSLSWPWP